MSTTASGTDPGTLPPEPDVLVLAPEPEPAPEPKADPEPKAAKVEKTFTAEDVERIRKEEKDKVYSTLEQTRTELETLRKEREERQKAEAEAKKAAEAAAKKAAEEEMSAKELLAQREQEWETRLSQIEAQRERDAALLEQERKFSALRDYTARRVIEEQDNILPELRDEVRGSNEQEVEESLSRMATKSAAILANVSAVTQQQRQQQRGVSVSAPPVGPLDTDTEYETVTADDIRNMDMNEYSKNRARLLGAASQRVKTNGYGA